MTDVTVVVRGRRVLAGRSLAPSSIHITGGRIVRLGAFDDVPDGAEVIDAGDWVVLPGLVDTHVHVNEPGRTDWEGFASATRAAAAGGVTTIVDMPLNSIPPTTTPAALAAKRAAASDRCSVDVGFWGGVVPDNAADLAGLWRDGVLGFKCFLAPSGVPEFEAIDEEALRHAMAALAALGDAPLLAHAELPAALLPPAGDPRSYRDYAASRPARAETEAIALLVRLCRQAGGRVPIHVVHLASAAALPLLRAARAGSLPVTAETCPHYLTFVTADVPAGATEFKCAPPLRHEADREALWQALAAGDLDLIASDHSPSPAALKRRESGDFFTAWGGIASLQLALPAVWTEASPRGHGLEAIGAWMAAGPARLAGLGARKGSIAPGHDADLVFFEPDTPFAVDGARLQHRHSLTPYHGRTLRGVVRRTFLRGEVVYDDGAFPGPPRGQLLNRPGRPTGPNGPHGPNR